jgi:O-antigen/teichoic acid export membrane protein
MKPKPPGNSGSVYNRSRARRSIFDTVMFRVMSQVGTVLSYVILVRGLSEQSLGVYSLFYAFIPVVSTFASLGLEQVLRRYQPEYLKTGQVDMAAWVVRFISRARLVANLVLLAVLLLGWKWLAPLFQLGPYRADFMIFAVFLVIYFQASILQLTLSAHMLHRFSMGSMAVQNITKVVLYAGLLLTHRLTLDNAIAIDAFTSAIQWLFMHIAYRRNCLPKVAAYTKPPAAEKKRMLRYGLLNNFNDAGALVLSSRTDNFFIAAIVNTVAVGAYGFYTRVIEMTNNALPMRLFDNVIQPMFFATPKEKAAERLPRYFSFLIDTSLLLQLPILAFVTIFHREIVQVVFAGKFIEHSWMLPFVYGFSVVNIYATPATLVAQYEEKAGVILLSKISAAYNVGSMLVLLPWLGLYGAALSTGTAQMMKNFIIWWHVRRTARWLHKSGVIGAAITIWGTVIGIGYAIKIFLPAPVLVHLAVGAVLVGLGALVYVRSPGLSTSDRELLANLLHGKEAKFLHLTGILPRPAP